MAQESIGVDVAKDWIDVFHPETGAVRLTINSRELTRFARRALEEDRRPRCHPKRKLVRGGVRYLLVCHHLLSLRWSAEQIAATLRRMHPDDPSARVSHETIYAMIYAQPRGGLKAAMTLALRQVQSKTW